MERYIKTIDMLLEMVGSRYARKSAVEVNSPIVLPIRNSTSIRHLLRVVETLLWFIEDTLVAIVWVFGFDKFMTKVIFNLLNRPP